MVDVRSENNEIKIERRAHPRLELHCDATVLGLKGIPTLTDISLGGCFIEVKIPGKVKTGQIITVNTKLPSERNGIKFKAKIVCQTERGIGCQFIMLKDSDRDAICSCFEMFKDTLPAEMQQDQPETRCLGTMTEVLPPEPQKRIKQSFLREVSDARQIKNVKSHGQNRLLLKVGISLIAVLVAGYFLPGTILRTSSVSEREAVIRHAVAATPQRHAIRIQTHSVDSIVNGGEKEAKNDQDTPIEEQKTQSQDVGLAQGQNVSQTGAKPMEIATIPLVSKEKAPTVALTKMPDLESNGTNDHKLEIKTTTNATIHGIHAIEIGPIFTGHDLKEATGILYGHGLDPEKISEMGTVKVVRLFEGSYTRVLAQKRLKEIKKVVNSAFVMLEKGNLSIYIATYHDRDKAIQKSKQLAKNNIKVILVPAEIKMKCTKLVVKQIEQPNISTVQDQMSEMGLSVNILKSG